MLLDGLVCRQGCGWSARSRAGAAGHPRSCTLICPPSHLGPPRTSRLIGLSSSCPILLDPPPSVAAPPLSSYAAWSAASSISTSSAVGPVLQWQGHGAGDGARCVVVRGGRGASWRCRQAWPEDRRGRSNQGHCLPGMLSTVT